MRNLSPSVKSLFEALLARAEQMDRLARALPSAFLMNRERREGTPKSRHESAETGNEKEFGQDLYDADEWQTRP